ncbi:MAG: peptidase, partial [Maritimibacter sp.]|nr:peptidase [Maritimibacter sp.]
KYGKPILDRVIGVDTPVDVCVTAALLSMDSTIRSNLSVGMPLDLAVINANQLCFARQVRIEDHDPNYLALSEAWSNALRNAFQDMNQITVV